MNLNKSRFHLIYEYLVNKYDNYIDHYDIIILSNDDKKYFLDNLVNNINKFDYEAYKVITVFIKFVELIIEEKIYFKNKILPNLLDKIEAIDYYMNIFHANYNNEFTKSIYDDIQNHIKNKKNKLEKTKEYLDSIDKFDSQNLIVTLFSVENANLAMEYVHTYPINNPFIVNVIINHCWSLGNEMNYILNKILEKTQNEEVKNIIKNYLGDKI